MRLWDFCELNMRSLKYDPSDYIVLDDHGTSHLAAADQFGNAISLTTSA